MWKHNDTSWFGFSVSIKLDFRTIIFYFYFTVCYVQRLYQQKVQICLLDENQYLYSSYAGKKGGKSKYWRCAQRTLFKCEAKCSTQNDNLKNFQGEHNHGPNFEILKDFSNVGPNISNVYQITNKDFPE